MGTNEVLEYPIGTALERTNGWFSHPRISPDGKLIAYIEHPVLGDDRGYVKVVDLATRKGAEALRQWPGGSPSNAANPRGTRRASAVRARHKANDIGHCANHAAALAPHADRGRNSERQPECHWPAEHRLDLSERCKSGEVRNPLHAEEWRWTFYRNHLYVSQRTNSRFGNVQCRASCGGWIVEEPLGRVWEVQHHIQ